MRILPKSGFATRSRLHFNLGGPPVLAVAAPTGVTSEGFALPEQIASLLPIVAFALIFWLLLVRPAARRRKRVAGMQSALAVGDQVMTSSGVYGTVRDLHDDRVSLEIADQVVITVARGAIGEVVNTDESAPEPAANSTELES